MSLVPYLHLEASLAGAAAGTAVAVDAEAHHHLTRVLRLRPGAPLVVSDGRGAVAEARLDGDEVVLAAPATVVPPPRPTLTVAQGLPRARKFDEVVRQVTELGVDRIVPVAATRSVTRLEGDRAQRAVQRWTSVARAAAAQSRRPWRPEVGAVVPARGLPGVLPPETRLLVAHVGAQVSLPEAVEAGRTADQGLAVAVGPEGGWDEAEVAAFVAAGATVVGLGPSVLRTEHAAAAAVAVLAAVGGRWS